MHSATLKQRCLSLCRQTGKKALHTHQAIRHSLKLRLIVLFWLLALGMGILFWGGMQKAFSIGWKEAARPLLMDYVDRLTAELGTPPDPERAAALVARLPITLRIDGPQVQWQSYPHEIWREHPIDRANAQRVLLRLTSDGHHVEWGLNADGFTQRPRLVWLVLTGLLILTALAYWLVRRWLHPLDDIGAGVRRFGAGVFEHPIPVRHIHAPDELGQLAQTINTMGQDIHQMLEAKRSLLLSISHELRSPLTRARLHAELLPETTEVQAQRDALMRDLEAMALLISDLLESERLSGTHQVLQREWVDVQIVIERMLSDDSVLHRAASTLQPASNPSTKQIRAQLSIASDVPAHLHLDVNRFRVLLRNLLLNAWRYGHGWEQSPEVDLTWLADASPNAAISTTGTLFLKIRDFGPGVEEEQLEKLAQAFYRPDSARTRESGGVGLGLYLCRLIAQAHGGHLSLKNAHPGLAVHVYLHCDSRAKA